MLIGNNYIFSLIVLLNIVTPFLIVIFLKKPWEKIPIYYGIIILYIISSAWILHFFHLLTPYVWKIITFLSFSLFLLFFWKNKYWLLFELKKKIKFTLPSVFLYIFMIGWIFITYFRTLYLWYFRILERCICFNNHSISKKVALLFIIQIVGNLPLDL